MTLIAHIEKIKQACREVLELDAAATAAPWIVETSRGLEYVPASDQLKSERKLPKPYDWMSELWLSSEFSLRCKTGDNLCFIATARSFTPAAARAVLGVTAAVEKGIHAAECDVYLEGLKPKPCDCWKANALRAIAEQFPMEDGE